MPKRWRQQPSNINLGCTPERSVLYEFDSLSFVQFLFCVLAAGAVNAMVVILIMALIEGGRSSSSKNWSSAYGVITESYVTSERKEESSKPDDFVYRPVLAYEYVVGGRRYAGSRIYFGALQKDKERAASEKKLTAYPVGAPVSVFYNPALPSDAVLERTSPQAGFLGRLALGLMVTSLVALAFAFLIPKWVG